VHLQEVWGGDGEAVTILLPRVKTRGNRKQRNFHLFNGLKPIVIAVYLDNGN
jgi:hypothetical protein